LDKFFLPGINYYRLKQTDFDGTSTYSQVVKAEQPGDISLINIFYLLDEDAVLINWNAAHDDQIILSVCDLSDRVLQKQSAIVSAGFNQIKMKLSPGLHGMLLLIVDSGESEKYVEKLEVL